MTAVSSQFIQKFLNKYILTQTSLGTILVNNVGLQNPKLYQKPTPEVSEKVQEFLRTLADFEASALADKVDPVKTQQLMDKVVSLMQELELTAVRPKEAGVDKDWLLFKPLIKDQNTPVKVAAILAYRFGFIIDRLGEGANHTVGNLGLLSEHSIADGAERLTSEVFLETKGKFILANLFRPHAVPNKDYDPTKPGFQIKYFTDPAHSTTTIFVPMVTTLLQELYPEIPVLIMHGMGAPLGKEYQALIGNCYGKFRQDGWRSFANMLGVSFGIEDYFISPENKAANKPSPVVSICSQIPNFVTKGDKTVPMSGTKGNGTNGALRWPGSTITTNVDGHIGYFAKHIATSKILTGYACNDRMIHVETTGYIRSNKAEQNPNRTQFAKVIARAVRFYRDYDPAIHDIHRLKERFIARSQDMKRYPELFEPKVIANYKKNQAERYQKDTAAYLATFAKSKQLPPKPTVVEKESVTAQGAATIEMKCEVSDLNILESMPTVLLFGQAVIGNEKSVEVHEERACDSVSVSLKFR